jgi:hypothetical protein
VITKSYGLTTSKYLNKEQIAEEPTATLSTSASVFHEKAGLCQVI